MKPSIGIGIGIDKMVQLGTLLNLAQYRIVEKKARIAKSNISYSGTIRMVGVGQTYTSITSAYNASVNGDIIQLIDGTYDMSNEAGGYLLLNTSTKGVKIRGNANDKTAVKINQTANSYGIRLRDCGAITFENITFSSTQNNALISQDSAYSSIYCKFINCDIAALNTGATSYAFARVSSTSDLRSVVIELDNCTVQSNGSSGAFLVANSGINELFLISNSTIISNNFCAIRYASSNKGTIAIYDSTIQANSNSTIVQFGEDNFTYTNKIKQVDFRANMVSYSSNEHYGHAVLFGAGTDFVYAVNNEVNVPAINNSLSLGFVIKTMSESIGNSYFAGNKIVAPRPYYIKGGKNTISKYNSFVSNRDEWEGFGVLNPDATALSSGNTFTHNNVLGKRTAINAYLSTGETSEITMKGWILNNNKYKSNSGTYIVTGDGLDHLFSEKQVIWGNDNDSNSKLSIGFKLNENVSLIEDDVVLN